MKKGIVSIKCLLITLIVGGIYFYFQLPAFNIKAPSFWIFIILLTIIFSISAIVFESKDFLEDLKNNKKITKSIKKINKSTPIYKVSLVVMGILIGGFIIGLLSGSKIIQSKKYYEIMQVEGSTFADEISEEENINSIALMDTESAKIIGSRAIGSLTDLVSQFEVSEEYSQINYNKAPMKVAPLEYEGFLKYLNNKKEGIPGFVLADPINNTAKYVNLDKKIHYSKSSYFGKYVDRKLRLSYKTKMFGETYFETDDDNNPYWIAPVIDKKAGLFGAKTVIGCVVLDANDGTSNYYEIDEVPSWVDIVFNGYLLQEQYDWHGLYGNGYWNSVFGKVGCKKTTSDFGYKIIDDEVYIYTGVTSLTSDESNIGFVLMNSRTGKSKYFDLAGAEEYSAMEAAEGQVQHLGYKASFPSIINVGGQPTYIMVLKDNGGLVKLYAMVHVSQYSLVSTGTTEKEALQEYKKLLKTSGIKSENQDDLENNETFKNEVIIEDIRFINDGEETIVYISGNDKKVYKQSFSSNEDLILLRIGDTILVEYYNKDDSIRNISNFEKVDKAE